MKKSIYILLAFALNLTACTAPEEEEKGQIMEYSGEDESDIATETEVETETSQAEDVDDKIMQGTAMDNEHVLYCKIGKYNEPAVMVLDWAEEPDENNIYGIVGYYFYLKHGKKLDVQGFSDPGTRGIYLDETYKGEQTGYMQFTQDQWESETYWAPNKSSEDHQNFKSEDILFAEEGEPEISVKYARYKYDHKVPMHDGPEEYSMDATNELQITWIGDAYMAFRLNVVCTNGHLGSVNGVAEVKGNTAYFDNTSPEGYGACKLEFDLSVPGEITVIEKSCEDYHGARAYFDGTLYKTSK